MTLRDVIERHGYLAHGGDPDAASEAWEETGMEPGEVEGWLEARCFDPEAAEDMDEIGITPDMASVRTDAGSGGYVDTVGHKVAAGDLQREEACALLGIDASTVTDPFASDTPTASFARQ